MTKEEAISILDASRHSSEKVGTVEWNRALEKAVVFMQGVQDQEIGEADNLNHPKHADNVNHPKHYETGKFECIEVMEEIFGIRPTMSFCLLNAFKYLYRCMKKNNTVEDIEKGIWYLTRYLMLNKKITKPEEEEWPEGKMPF